MIWVCILCRKKQELVVKTGQWILPTGPGPMQQPSPLPSQQQQQLASSSSGVVSGLLMLNDKRPRLERAVSYETRDTISHHHHQLGHHRISSTSSVSFGSGGGGGGPGYSSAGPVQQPGTYQHAPLQRSGSLQSHGTSSWRQTPLQQMTSELDNPTARGDYIS